MTQNPEIRKEIYRKIYKSSSISIVKRPQIRKVFVIQVAYKGVSLLIRKRPTTQRRMSKRYKQFTAHKIQMTPMYERCSILFTIGVNTLKLH